MLLKSTSHLFVVHPTLSLTDWNLDQSHIAASIDQADFSRSILEQIEEDYDLLILDWQLETPDARGVLDAFRYRVPNLNVLVLSDDVPADDPVDRGADELLVGPTSDETLQTVIERLLLQRAYEKVLDEFFRLSTERVLLESELESGLDVAERYQAVVCNLYEVRRRAARIRDELTDNEFDRAFRQLLD